jgi:hypothetical protein
VDCCRAAGANRGAALRAISARFGIDLTDQRQLAVGGYVIKASRRTAGLLAALNARGDVEFAEPDTPMYALSTPNDPNYPQQWDYFEPTGGMNLPGAWDLSTGTGAVVAVPPGPGRLVRRRRVRADDRQQLELARYRCRRHCGRHRQQQHRCRRCRVQREGGAGPGPG